MSVAGDAGQRVGVRARCPAPPSRARGRRARARAMPSANRRAASQARGRQRGDGSRPSGNSSGIATATSPIHTSAIQSSSHIASARRVVGGRRVADRAPSVTALSSAIAWRIQPIGLRGCRLATTAPTSAKTVSAEHEQPLERAVLAARREYAAGERGERDPQPEQPPREPRRGHRWLLSHSETCAGWTVSATTPRRSRQRLEVDLVAQPAAERLERLRRRRSGGGRSGGRPTAWMRVRSRAEQRRHRQRRDRDREARLPDREPEQQHEAEVGAAQRRRQRAVDQRAVDDDVDVEQPVAQDRDPHRDRHRARARAR